MKTDAEILEEISIWVCGMETSEMTNPEKRIANLLVDKGLLKIEDTGYSKEYRRIEKKMLNIDE